MLSIALKELFNLNLAATNDSGPIQYSPDIFVHELVADGDNYLLIQADYIQDNHEILQIAHDVSGMEGEIVKPINHANCPVDEDGNEIYIVRDDKLPRPWNTFALVKLLTS